MCASVTVSVAIPTYARERVMCDTLRQLLALPTQPLEVLVVDQSPCHEEETEAFLRSLSHRVRWIRSTQVGLPDARNVALSEARGEVILFLDDDVVINSDLVGEHARCYRETTVTGVAGRVKQPLPSNGRDRRTKTGKVNLWSCMPSEDWDSDLPAEVDWCTGGNMSFRTEALKEVAGFDQTYNVNPALLEETDACVRLRLRGGRLVYWPGASLIHIAAPTGGTRVSSFEAYIWSLSRNRTYFARKHAHSLQRLTTLFRLAVTICSFTVRRRNVKLLSAGWRGVRDAYRLQLRGPGDAVIP